MTDPHRSAAEMRGLLRFALGLGLDEVTVREIYATVGEQAAEAEVAVSQAAEI